LLLRLLLLLLVFEILELLELLKQLILHLVWLMPVWELTLAHPTEYRILYEACSIKMPCRLWLPSQLGIGFHPDASH